jgi:hypothetical protein
MALRTNNTLSGTVNLEFGIRHQAFMNLQISRLLLDDGPEAQFEFCRASRTEKALQEGIRNWKYQAQKGVYSVDADQLDFKLEG